MNATPERPYREESDPPGLDISIDMKLGRKNTFKKRLDSISGPPGANLVVNRKSLNIEATKHRHEKIRAEN